MPTDETYQKFFRPLADTYRTNFYTFLNRADKQYYDCIKAIIYLSAALMVAVFFLSKGAGAWSVVEWGALACFAVSLMSGLFSLFHSAHNSFKRASEYDKKINNIDRNKTYEDPEKIMALWTEEIKASPLRGFFIKDSLVIGLVTIITFCLGVGLFILSNFV